MDQPDGNIRLSYVRLDGMKLTAFAVLAVTEPIDGTPCFQIGVAVPEQFRRQGRAKEIMTAALAEMASGFGRAGVKEFYVEAIVSVDNEASNRAAASVLSDDPKSVTDQFSGEPALQYLRLVETKRK